ncbi:hypothetical protein CEXT_187301 [Caerostris extrusa]|uniref:Uncharacterized protein n=1 Tax=Caerostris extrusa TaxID=172846 RepID=A0AAV4VSQ3_CAEEX|nr:hypothetical protein CEXT_187301 [Caerostris extrusa]
MGRRCRPLWTLNHHLSRGSVKRARGRSTNELSSIGYIVVDVKNLFRGHETLDQQVQMISFVHFVHKDIYCVCRNKVGKRQRKLLHKMDGIANGRGRIDDGNISTLDDLQEALFELSPKKTEER